jgi:hypothetical protein
MLQNFTANKKQSKIYSQNGDVFDKKTTVK